MNKLSDINNIDIEEPSFGGFLFSVTSMVFNLVEEVRYGNIYKPTISET